MSRKWLITSLVIVFCLGVWLGMQAERWLQVDGCLDAGGAINIEHGFSNCQLG